MEKRYPKRVGELITTHIVNSDPFINATKEERVTSSWGRVVGSNIASYTTRLYMRDRKLYVGFSSSLVRSEFMRICSQVLYKLNGEVGEKYVIKIVVLH